MADLTRAPSRYVHTTPTPSPPSPSTPLPPPLVLPESVPHLVIHPPQEDTLNAPYYYDGADEEPDSDYEYFDGYPSDSQFINVGLEYYDEPIPRSLVNEVQLSRRKSEKRNSSVLNFMRNEVGEGRQHGARELPEDIIEVIKVKRNEGRLDPRHTLAPKRSKTLRMPFKKAFMSIRNAGKGSVSKKAFNKDAPAPSNTPRAHEETIPRSPSPGLSRQTSRRISQLFTRYNHSNTDVSFTPSETTQTSSTLPRLRTEPAFPLVDNMGFLIDNGERPLSPSLSTKRSSRRFSVMDLHRLFTFSPSPSVPTEDADVDPRSSEADDVQSLPSLVSHDLSSPPSTSTVSSEFPTPAPSDEDTQAPNVNDKAYWRTFAETCHSDDQPVGVPRDISFEMRLESLHFDSLSFDPEEFDVSMGLDGHRRVLVG